MNEQPSVGAEIIPFVGLCSNRLFPRKPLLSKGLEQHQRDAI